jgi:hypothetical protein
VVPFNLVNFFSIKIWVLSEAAVDCILEHANRQVCLASYGNGGILIGFRVTKNMDDGG